MEDAQNATGFPFTIANRSRSSSITKMVIDLTTLDQTFSFYAQIVILKLRIGALKIQKGMQGLEC
jgi:hypothetical protein